MVKTVAVTGASGLLGRRVVTELSRRFAVVAIDLVPASDHHTKIADMLDLAALVGAFAGSDAVVHLAALDGARTASEEAFIATNTLGCWNALRAAELNGIRKFVLCSSVASLGIGPDRPPMSLPVTVDHPKTPIAAYGISKQLCETLAEAFVRRGTLDVVCLRPCFVMFPHLVAEVAELSAQADGVPTPAGLVRSAIAMNEPLTPTRCFISPRDAARAFAASLDAELPGFSAFFVAGPDTFCAKPTPDLVEDVFGVRPPILDPDLFRDSPRASVFDLRPTRAALGWSPRDHWTDLVAAAVSGSSLD